MKYLLVAGDLVPTSTNYGLFESKDIYSLLGEDLLRVWRNADYRIANLEAPIINEGIPKNKSGPAIKIPIECVEGLKAMGIDVYSIANNHIMDYGIDGLSSTIKQLNSGETQITGGGENISYASAPAILTHEKLKIGIYSCAEHEFSSSDRQSAGANVLGVNTCLDISRLKEKVDYLITLFHGGKEHSRYPTMGQRDLCKDMIDAGADIVICQHSHCIGCEEKYNNKTILYGQGNFLFDYKDIECWKTGFLVRINIWKDDDRTLTDVDYIPIVKNSNTVRLAKETESKSILDEFRIRSENLCDESYMKLVDKEFEGIGLDNLYFCAGFNRLLRGIDKRLLHNYLIRRKYNKNKMKELLGVIQCETHRELIENWLRKMIDES